MPRETDSLSCICCFRLVAVVLYDILWCSAIYGVVFEAGSFFRSGDESLLAEAEELVNATLYLEWSDSANLSQPNIKYVNASKGQY